MFLAIAVDKLSEVRSLEQRHVKEHKKMKEERKVREERIHALKDTSEPQVHRRTLRKVLRFYTDEPSRRTQMGEARKHGWQHQFSMPIVRSPRRGESVESFSLSDGSQSEYRRSLSAPEGSPSTHGVSEPQGSGAEHVIPKLQNPLRLMKRTSSFFDKQARHDQRRKGRGGRGRGESGGQSTSAADKDGRAGSTPAAVRSNVASAALTSASTSAKDQDVFVFSDVKSPTLHQRVRQLSSPDGLPLQSQFSPALSYERTQSLPGWSPIPETPLIEEMPKLELVDEGSKVKEDASTG